MGHIIKSVCVCQQWLKCKIRGGGTLHSGLGPGNGRVPFPSIITIWSGERFEW